MTSSKMTARVRPAGRAVRRLGRAFGFATALTVLAVATSPLSAAETIASALAAAYIGNPTLNAERARQRADDELVPQALSGWRPTVTAQGDAGYRSVNSNPASTASGDTTPAGLSINLAQPLFRGFKTVAGTRQAEATVEAGKQQLLSVEQQVLFEAASAFMDVIRDRNVVLLRQKTVSFLEEELRAANARFSVGEITRTDVAQAQARLSLAKAELEVARARRAASVASYERIVGHQPDSLKFPPISRRVPKSLDEALEIAARINPQVLAAAYAQQAAEHNVDVVNGDLLPTVQLEAQYSLQNEPSSSIRSTEDMRVFGSINIPLYEAGRTYSQVRQAKQVASQRRIQIVEAGRTVRAAVVQSWNNFMAAGQTIVSLEAQVSANQLALEGVRQEALVGTRTTLDVLDAERELVNSRVSLITAQRDQIVAAYQLLVATGQMTAPALGLNVAVYDADGNQIRVRGKFFGTAVETVD
jgi:TolC family type I secretion outer membrane protein